jgi:DNA-binding NarL/FixJ family response regulator
MTLPRSNPEVGRQVINRTDDSTAPHTRVGVVGVSGLSTDVIIEALLATGISAWRIGGDGGARLIDALEEQGPDLVLLNVGSHGYTESAGRLISKITDGRPGVIVLGAGDDQTAAEGFSAAGALCVLDPSTTSFEELVGAIRMAAGLTPSTEREVRLRLAEARRSRPFLSRLRTRANHQF